MKKNLIILTVFLLAMPVLALGKKESPLKTPDLAVLEKSWKESRDKYRNALKDKSNAVWKEIEQKEGLLANEGGLQKRRTLMDALKDLRGENEELTGRIREINASDVVKFATGRDKILSVLTGQKPA